jgi:hypothetical protein
MPSLSFNWIQNNINAKDININYPTFVESGTHVGNTIIPLDNFFQKLHTIEIKKEFYESTKQKYKGNKIQFHLGDASIILKDICKIITSPVIFFLDGHWSAGNTGRGDKDCPLYEELSCIMTYCNHKCIIIVDDCRLFGKGPSYNNEVCNWEDINATNILSLVDKRLNNHYYASSELYEKDRLILHLDSI